MKSFSQIRLVSVLAVVLGIAVTGALVPGSVRSAAPTSGAQPDATTVARARASFIKHMSSRRPMVRSSVTPLAASNGGATSMPAVNWSGYTDVEGGSKTVSSVSGQWVIPYVQCPSGTYR